MPELGAEDGPRPKEESERVAQEELEAGRGSRVPPPCSLPPHACLQCRGLPRRGRAPFPPQDIWGCIRHNDLVKKIVMEICNRETLSKASLKSLLHPQPGGGNWKLENWEPITGPSKWPKCNPICRFKDG